jgi:hypothetical protein
MPAASDETNGLTMTLYFQAPPSRPRDSASNIAAETCGGHSETALASAWTAGLALLLLVLGTALLADRRSNGLVEGKANGLGAFVDADPRGGCGRELAE